MPSTTPSQRVEGPIKAIGSTRTNRIVEVGEVKLEVEPSTWSSSDASPHPWPT
jgi:hypothetical protein